MAALSQELIDEIVRRVLTVCQPDKIILFGSAARGDMGPDSDIDLLVVDRQTTDRYTIMGRLYESMRGVGRPCDIVVVPVDWFERFKDIMGTIAYPASKEGRVIYEPR